ncbi:hypothetical protein MTP99_012074 [Tenebrio molitor]|jgi:hypothetical protein|nr:hypothetical protein MTP99_012074 [Tenebrio molitor]
MSMNKRKKGEVGSKTCSSHDVICHVDDKKYYSCFATEVRGVLELARFTIVGTRAVRGNDRNFGRVMSPGAWACIRARRGGGCTFLQFS